LEKTTTSLESISDFANSMAESADMNRAVVEEVTVLPTDTPKDGTTDRVATPRIVGTKAFVETVANAVARAYIVTFIFVEFQINNCENKLCV